MFGENTIVHLNDFFYQKILDVILRGQRCGKKKIQRKSCENCSFLAFNLSKNYCLVFLKRINDYI